MRQFTLNGRIFTEGDTLTITTAEHGSFGVSTAVQFGHDSVVSLTLTPINQAPGCLANWSLYTNGQQYHSLQLAYHCSCPHNAHRRSLGWMAVTIDGSTVQAGEARSEKPLPPTIPFKNLPPSPVVAPEYEAPILETKANQHGQIQLF